MAEIIVVGFSGRMSQKVMEILKVQGKPFKVYSEKAPHELRVNDFESSAGVIDFSSPEVSERVLQLALTARVPYVCGTTGWKSLQETKRAFENAGKSIPVLLDSNFSLGIELFCQAAEKWTRTITGRLHLTDIHHIHKKDAPSGTALKIKDRIEAASPQKVDVQSIREGEVFGEHRLLLSFGDEELEVIHRAQSRAPFAEGAVRALEWLQKQKPGFYSMKDMLT